MQMLTKAEMMERLERDIAAATPGDLADFHNDLFPREKITDAQASKNPARVLAKIQKKLGAGMHPEEIVELWNIVVVEPRCAEYDEEEDRYMVRPLLPVPADF
ncbi:MAG: hypothetical protein K2W96_24335 [Gemmataceae bacterium]|nr:hypothetical protein [Gemmataceae bacterium]